MRQLLGSILSALLICVAAEAQTIRKVPLDFPTIQAAIVASQNGDTVRVAPGTYVENINFLGKAITVASEAGAKFTTIDGNQAGSVVVINSGEGLSSILEGFTIRNGKRPENGAFSAGGVTIQNSSPTIRRNRIVSNLGCNGVGISIQSGSPVIQNNVITDNKTFGCSTGIGGGGILVFTSLSAQILENTISNNTSMSGGGITILGGGAPSIRGKKRGSTELVNANLVRIWR